MPGALSTWPDWPEFTTSKAEQSEDLVKIKEAIVSEYGEDSLTKSWLKVCHELSVVTDEIAEKGSSSIPEVQYDEFFALNTEQKQKIRDVGCLVIRNVFSKEQTGQWFRDLKDYVASNRQSISGWPQATPFILKLYYSPTQIAARSHPNQLKVSEELNSWWHDDSGVSSPEPLSYVDAVRIRPPGIPFRGLGPHIDAGSLSRWADPHYRSVYDAVFSGSPELLDNYDLNKRQDVQQALFPGPGHSRIFRSFQGWTALTSAGPGEGSLMLYPNIKWSIAYVMLRPFFSPPECEQDIMDASKWEFDATSSWFPGTFRGESQNLSPSSHPHLRLRECMVNIPRMDEGDTIWWHADMCHAVEVEHNGDHEASVMYIAASPRTEENKRYIKAQLEDFLNDKAPVDFGGRKGEQTFKLYTGEKGILSGEQGRRAFGFDLIAEES